MSAFIDIARSKTLRWAAGLIAGYFLAVSIVPYSWVGQTVNAVRLALAIAVVIAYSPLAVEAIRAPRINQTHQLVLGIVMAWGSLAAISAWAAAGQLLGFATRVADSAVSGLFVFCMILAAVLHLTAPSAANDEFEVRNWWAVTAAVAIGCLIGGFLLATAWWNAGSPVE